MRLWHAMAGELIGAWRSVRYDLGRGRGTRATDRIGADRANNTERANSTNRRNSADRGDGADGADGAGSVPGYPAYAVGRSKRARRPMAATGVAMLVAGGAAGTYFAIAGGLTALTTESVQPFQAAAPPATPETIATQHATPAAPHTRRAVVPSVVGGPAHRSRRPSPRPTEPVPITIPAPPSTILETDLPSPDPSPSLTWSPSDSPSPTAPPSSDQHLVSAGIGAGG